MMNARHNCIFHWFHEVLLLSMNFLSFWKKIPKFSYFLKDFVEKISFFFRIRDSFCLWRLFFYFFYVKEFLFIIWAIFSLYMIFSFLYERSFSLYMEDSLSLYGRSSSRNHTFNSTDDSENRYFWVLIPVAEWIHSALSLGRLWAKCFFLTKTRLLKKIFGLHCMFTDLNQTNSRRIYKQLSSVAQATLLGVSQACFSLDPGCHWWVSGAIPRATPASGGIMPRKRTSTPC